MNFISNFYFSNNISIQLSGELIFHFLSVFGYHYTDKKYPKMAILIKKKTYARAGYREFFSEYHNPDTFRYS